MPDPMQEPEDVVHSRQVPFKLMDVHARLPPCCAWYLSTHPTETQLDASHGDQILTCQILT
jgi:hypothetical protein